MKHTQGPWGVKNHGMVYTMDNMTAICSTDVEVGNDEEAQANAKLIAAAPELLEALRLMLAYPEGCPMDVTTQARAAIDKATK